MSILLSVIIVAEVLFTLLIVWGFKHEEKVVAFEDKIIFAIKRKVRITKRNLCDKWLADDGLTVAKKGDKKNVRKQL